MELYNGRWYRVVMGVMTVLCGLSFYSYGAYIQWFAATPARRTRSDSDMVEYDWHGMLFYLTQKENGRANILLWTLIATYALAAFFVIAGLILRWHSHHARKSA